MSPELIVFLIIVILSLLESAAKKRTRRRQGEGVPGPAEPVPEWPWEVEEPSPRVPSPAPPRPRAEEREPRYGLPTYDEERSYDEMLAGEEVRSYDDERARDVRTFDEALERARRTFDEMPTFDEVQAERERAATRPPPDAESAEALILARRRGLERAARAPEQPPSIHAAHAQFGTDPSARAPAPAPVAPAGGGAAATLARELRARDAARRAVVLQEVLGPPAALRPPRLDGLE